MNRLESKTVIDDCGTFPGPVNCQTSERIKWGDEFRRSIVPWSVVLFQVRLDCDLLAGLVPGLVATMSAIERVKDGAPRLGIALFDW